MAKLAQVVTGKSPKSNSKPKVGLSYSLAPANAKEPVKEGEPDDKFEEFDSPKTIDALAKVLENAGFEVVHLGDGEEFLKKAVEHRKDLQYVWNIAEGHGTSRNREARIPAVLEMLGIPYSGSDATTLGMALDKDVARKTMEAAGVLVPGGFSLTPEMSRERSQAVLAEQATKIPFPWILKPAFEGSSKGVRAKAVVNNLEEAKALYEQLAKDYEQPIVAEQFIRGEEVTVGLVGNGNEARVFGTMKITPKTKTDNFVYSIEVKRDYLNQVDYQSPAQFPPEVDAKLRQAALDVCRVLQCKDFARADFRVENGKPYFIEVNPLPGLSPITSDLVIMATAMGVTHEQLVNEILDASLKRHGIERPKK